VLSVQGTHRRDTGLFSFGLIVCFDMVQVFFSSILRVSFGIFTGIYLECRVFLRRNLRHTPAWGGIPGDEIPLRRAYSAPDEADPLTFLSVLNRHPSLLLALHVENDAPAFVIFGVNTRTTRQDSESQDRI